MMSGKWSAAAMLAVACTLVLPAGSAMPAADPRDAGGLLDVLPDDLPFSTEAGEEAVRSTLLQVPLPDGGEVHFGQSGPADGGVREMVNLLVQYVEEFDPGDDLPTQTNRTHALMVNMVRVSMATVQCVAFVAGDLFGGPLLDAQEAPNRIVANVPFAMAGTHGYTTGHLMIVMSPTGEMECGTGSSDPFI